MPRLKCLFLLLCTVHQLAAQMPFNRIGQVFMTKQTPEEIAEFKILPSYNTASVSPFSPAPGGGINALGFRKTDNLLYGIGQANLHIYKIGQGGSAQDLGTAGLNTTYFYLAGDVTPDGKYLVSVGSNDQGKDVHLAITNLENGNLSTEFVPLVAAGHLSDIAFHPTNGSIFGCDGPSNKIVKINKTTGQIDYGFNPAHYENTLLTLFFDAFGDLFGYGRAVNGIVDGCFSINQSTGKEKLLATSPVESVTDGASCPYSFGFKVVSEPEVVLPCSKLKFQYSIANNTGQTIDNAWFRHVLPNGLHTDGAMLNPFSQIPDTTTIPGTILMGPLTINPGTSSFSFNFWAGDLPKQPYRSQAILEQLPALYGQLLPSDNPKVAGWGDSTLFKINRFDEDSLEYNWLLCKGNTLKIDASEFGNQLQWNTGSQSPELNVSQTSNYTLNAGNTCEFVVVEHHITATSCPYTIELAFMPLPNDSFFACSEQIFRYFLNNESGESRYHLSIQDDLPDGFSILEVLPNTVGATLSAGTTPNQLLVKNITMRPGIDTVDVRVRIGDLPPGAFSTRARLQGLPLLMGPYRWSDNPLTFEFDSTQMVILPSGFEDMYRDTLLCPNGILPLNGSQFGQSLLWDNGSTLDTFLVKAPGDYELKVLDGCYPSSIFWHVEYGEAVQVFGLDEQHLHQGASISLSPLYNAGSGPEVIRWTDPLSTSLSCTDCPKTIATPLEEVAYTFYVSNGICADSTVIRVIVDKSRRIYTGNIFNPDGDYPNNRFGLQSPDAGNIQHFRVFDRWGNIVFQVINGSFNTSSSAWDGSVNNQPAPAGVYLWETEIVFPDGEKKAYKGDVTVVR